MTNSRNGDGREVTFTRRRIQFRIRKRKEFMAKMENGFLLYVHPNPLQQLPKVFLNPGQVTTIVNID